MGIAGLILYGAWAFVANYSHGVVAAAKAAATQGFVSMTSTILVTGAMEFVVRRVTPGWQ